MKPIYLQDRLVVTGVVHDEVGETVPGFEALVAAIPLTHRALLMVECGSIADSGRCPECRAKVGTEIVDPPATPPSEIHTGAVVTSTPPVRNDVVVRPRSVTGHYSDVDCLIDASLTASGYGSRSERDTARLKLISG